MTILGKGSRYGNAARFLPNSDEVRQQNLPSLSLPIINYGAPSFNPNFCTVWKGNMLSLFCSLSKFFYKKLFLKTSVLNSTSVNALRRKENHQYQFFSKLVWLCYDSFSENVRCMQYSLMWWATVIHIHKPLKYFSNVFFST